MPWRDLCGHLADGCSGNGHCDSKCDVRAAANLSSEHIQMIYLRSRLLQSVMKVRVNIETWWMDHFDNLLIALNGSSAS
jgi:hypothetical protein